MLVNTNQPTTHATFSRSHCCTRRAARACMSASVCARTPGCATTAAQAASCRGLLVLTACAGPRGHPPPRGILLEELLDQVIQRRHLLCVHEVECNHEVDKVLEARVEVFLRCNRPSAAPLRHAAAGAAAAAAAHSATMTPPHTHTLAHTHTHLRIQLHDRLEVRVVDVRIYAEQALKNNFYDALKRRLEGRVCGARGRMRWAALPFSPHPRTYPSTPGKWRHYSADSQPTSSANPRIPALTP